MWAVFKRELKSYFTGMLGYVVAAVMLFFLGLFFTNQCLMLLSPEFGVVLYGTLMVLIFMVPALTMRSFAEERRSKTDQLLLTSPVSIPAIVGGKFLAQLAVFCLPLAAASVMPLILTAFGRVGLLSAYISLLAYLLLGAACLSIGTFLSTITESSIIAYLATFGTLLVCYMANEIRTMFSTGQVLALCIGMVILAVAGILVGVQCKSLWAAAGTVAGGAALLILLFVVRPTWLLAALNKGLASLALFVPFQNVVGGTISVEYIVYYLSVVAVFLFLSGQSLERRRWH